MHVCEQWLVDVTGLNAGTGSHMNDGIFDFPIYDESNCTEGALPTEDVDIPEQAQTSTEESSPIGCSSEQPSPTPRNEINNKERNQKVDEALLVYAQNFDSLHERIDYLTEQLAGLQDQLVQLNRSSAPKRFANDEFGFDEPLNSAKVDPEFGSFSDLETEPEVPEIPEAMKDQLQKLFAKFQTNVSSENGATGNDPIQTLELTEQLVHPESDY